VSGRRARPALRARGCRRARLAALALALAAPATALAHEVLHEVRPAGAVAVRASYADGEALAYSSYEVWSPTDPKIPWQKGRTDREGWLAFVASTPGAWRVRVVGADGHGLDTLVEVAAPGPAAGPAATPTASPATAAGGLGAALRPLLGVLLIAALFGGLLLAYRRRRPR
jgi:nickel transport protein